MRAFGGRPRAAFGGAWVTCSIALLASAASSQTLLDETVQAQAQSDTAAVRSQLRISQLADETTELLGEYRLALQQLDRVRIYNDNLAALVADQEAEKASIGQQLEDFVIVEQGIVPLMFNMIDALEQFVALDLPFQLRERVDRVRRLRDNMDSSEITISEKYRQIMDAYVIETDFGRTVEAYVDTLDLDGVEIQVDVLRIGRVLLAYQTPDRTQTGFFNQDTGAWEPLPDDYRASITQGLRIARRQAAPDLLRLPIHAAEARR
jgi:RES domain-containing protein